MRMDSIEKYLNRKDIPLDVREVIKREFAQRKEVEDTLRKHVQMIDFADDTIMIRDLEDKIIYWNKGAERLYGWTKEEALGKDVHAFLKTIFPKSLKEALKACRRTGYWEGELRHFKRDGSTVTVASRWTLQRDEKGKPIAFLEINNDITELKKTEAELLGAHDQLEKRVEERTAELKKTNRELQRLINERKRLEKEILEISGKEQRRIGQDLHDGLSQLLTGIALMGKVLEQKLVNKALPEASQVKKIVELVNQAVTQTRGLARGLYPVELESNGLMSSLQELASNTEKLFNVTCYFHCDRPILIDDYVVANHLYRIAQEAVTNAVKHGKPKHVSIQLGGQKDKIFMEIKDDGLGIPIKLNKSKGMGLRIMEYRAEMIRASLNIHRDDGHGTVVECIFRKARAQTLKKRNGYDQAKKGQAFKGES